MDETGFCKAYDTIEEAVSYCGIWNSSATKYAMDNYGPFVMRRSDKKILGKRNNKRKKKN